MFLRRRGSRLHWDDLVRLRGMSRVQGRRVRQGGRREVGVLGMRGEVRLRRHGDAARLGDTASRYLNVMLICESLCGNWSRRRGLVQNRGLRSTDRAVDFRLLKKEEVL